MGPVGTAHDVEPLREEALVALLARVPAAAADVVQVAARQVEDGSGHRRRDGISVEELDGARW